MSESNTAPPATQEKVNALVDSIKGPPPERTEMDIVLMQGEVVTFGGKEYQMSPARFAHGNTWRVSLSKAMEKIQKNSPEIDMTNPLEMNRQGIIDALSFNLKDFPGEMWKLVKGYDTSLPWKEIDKEVLDFEVARAFEAVCRMALPFADALARGMQNRRSP